MAKIMSEHLSNVRLRNQKRMLYVLAITVSFMLIEVVTAWQAKSLALLADAGHMLTDVGAIVLGLIASWFAGRPATAEKTYGYYRSEILASLVNALLLVGVSFLIIHEAWQRLKISDEVLPIPVLGVAFVGLVVNLFCLRVLDDSHDGKKQSLSIKAISLEVLGDALVSIGVIISSLVILFFHWYKADAVISLFIGLFILPRTWILLSECTNILMEGTPQHIDLRQLREAMLAVSGVADVHDIHVWTITSGLDSMSAHVLIDEQSNLDKVLEEVTKVLQEKFSLNHTTIQIEQVACQKEANICS